MGGDCGRWRRLNAFGEEGRDAHFVREKDLIDEMDEEELLEEEEEQVLKAGEYSPSKSDRLGELT